MRVWLIFKTHIHRAIVADVTVVRFSMNIATSLTFRESASNMMTCGPYHLRVMPHEFQLIFMTAIREVLFFQVPWLYGKQPVGIPINQILFKLNEKKATYYMNMRIAVITIKLCCTFNKWHWTNVVVVGRVLVALNYLADGLIIVLTFCHYK